MARNVWEAPKWPEMVWEAPKWPEMVWEAPFNCQEWFGRLLNAICRSLEARNNLGVLSKEILVGKLEQEASKRPARASKRPAKKPTRSQQEASKRPAKGQQDASKRPARGQQEASKRPGRSPKWGGPHETPKPLKNSYFHAENSPILRAL